MFTLPNILSLGRLVLLPFVLWLSYSTRLPGLIGALVLFNLGALSDWLDGLVARRYEMDSRFGKLLDPVVDKIFILSVFFVLSDLQLLPLWLVLLVMAREFLVSAVRHGFTTPAEAVGANWMGKTKFVLQVLIIELAYLHLVLQRWDGGIPAGEPVLFWLMLGMTAFAYAFLLAFARRFIRRVPSGSSAADDERGVDEA